MYTPDRWHQVQQDRNETAPVQPKIVEVVDPGFRPTDSFLVWLKNTVKARSVIDLSLSSVSLVDKALKYGIQIVGPSADTFLAPTGAAASVNWNQEQIVLACSPCPEALERALLLGIECYYVTKSIRYDSDLVDKGLSARKAFLFAGEDGETAYLLNPFSNKKKLRIQTCVSSKEQLK